MKISIMAEEGNIAELFAEGFMPTMLAWLRDDVLTPLFAQEREAGREPHPDTLAVLDMLTKGIDGTLTKEQGAAAHRVASAAERAYWEARTAMHASYEGWKASRVAHAAMKAAYAASHASWLAHTRWLVSSGHPAARGAAYAAREAVMSAGSVSLSLSPDSLNSALEARVLQALKELKR